MAKGLTLFCRARKNGIYIQDKQKQSTVRHRQSRRNLGRSTLFRLLWKEKEFFYMCTLTLRQMMTE